MKQKDIAAFLDEPACAHNKKEKSGCDAMVKHVCGGREPDPVPEGVERDGFRVHDVTLVGEYNIAGARIPFPDINQERDFGYEGHTGMLEPARQLCLTIESRVWEAVRRPAPWAKGLTGRTVDPNASAAGPADGVTGEVGHG